MQILCEFSSSFTLLLLLLIVLSFFFLLFRFNRDDRCLCLQVERTNGLCFCLE